MTIHKQRLQQARFGSGAPALTGPPPASPRRFWSPVDRLAWLTALLRRFMLWLRALVAARQQAGASRPIALTGRRALLALIAEREHLTEILLIIPSAGIAVLTYYGVSLPLT